MQFRRRANRVQLLRYRYDAERKRASQELVGTVDWHNPQLLPELGVNMTLLEREEFTEWAEMRRMATERTYAKHALKGLVTGVRMARMALEAGAPVPGDIGGLEEELGRLRAALRKAMGSRRGAGRRQSSTRAR